MIVNDSTNKWHSGKKKHATDNAIKVAVFRKRHTHGPLTDQQIAAALEDNKLQQKAKQSPLTLAEKRRQRKIRILAAKIKYDKDHPKPDLSRKTPVKKKQYHWDSSKPAPKGTMFHVDAAYANAVLSTRKLVKN